MNLTCPHCGFSKEIDAGRLPEGSTRATCPRCRESFPLGRNLRASVGTTAAAAPCLFDREAEAPPKAGFWIRLVAFLIDSVLITAVQVALGFALGWSAALIGGLPVEERELTIAVVTWLAGSILGMLYYVLFTGYCGQTPGKMAVRVKVIRTDGSAITYGRAFLRETLGKFLSGIILGAGYLMIAFDPQKQGLHDKIADSYVIKL